MHISLQVALGLLQPRSLRWRKIGGADSSGSAASPGSQPYKCAKRRGVYFREMDTSASEGARFQPASDQSLLITFGSEISLSAHQLVMKLLRLLQLEPIAGLRNLHPAYCSLLVKFDGFRISHDDVEAILRECLARLEDVKLLEPR